MISLPIWLVSCIIIFIVSFICGKVIISRTQSNLMIPDFLHPIVGIGVWIIGLVSIVIILMCEFIF